MRRPTAVKLVYLILSYGMFHKHLSDPDIVYDHKGELLKIAKHFKKSRSFVYEVKRYIALHGAEKAVEKLSTARLYRKRKRAKILVPTHDVIN